MKIELYVDVKPGTMVSHDMLPADRKIELQLGSVFADDSMLRLAFSEPETLTQLAKVAIDARAALLLELRRGCD